MKKEITNMKAFKTGACGRKYESGKFNLKSTERVEGVGITAEPCTLVTLIGHARCKPRDLVRK